MQTRTGKRTHRPKSQTAFFSESFDRFLCKHLKGFADVQPIDHRLALANMVLQAANRYRQHAAGDDAARFHYLELEEWFGRGGFERLNRRLHLFEVGQQWSKKDGETKPYRLSKHVEALRDKYLRNRLRRNIKPDNFLTEDGRSLAKLPSGSIHPKNIDGRTRRGFAGLSDVLEIAVPVDMGSLRELITDIDARIYLAESNIIQADFFHAEPERSQLEAVRTQAMQIYTKAQNGVCFGKVPTRYREYTTGRYFAEGAANLQSCSRLVRHAAMVGMWDIDIENCHFALLAQLSKKAGHHAQAIEHYLDNKAMVRQQIAADIGADIRTAKDSLLMTIYGAIRSNRAEDAIPRVLGGDMQKAATLYQHPAFATLYEDVRVATAAVVKAFPPFRDKVENCRGLYIPADKSDAKILAHILQGLEAAALEAAFRLFPDDIVLLQHDGFTSRRRLTDGELHQVQRAMAEATGCTLKVEQKQIQVDYGASFPPHERPTLAAA